MKRIGIFVSLLLLFASPSMVAANNTTTHFEIHAMTELPWATVQQVLKKVADMGTYTYGQLVAGYNNGTVTVEQSGTSYVVTITDADGATDVIIMDGM
jgi:hypothetical protein